MDTGVDGEVLRVSTKCGLGMLPIAEGREEDDSHMITPCNHAFHARCLSQWYVMRRRLRYRGKWRMRVFRSMKKR